MKQGPYKLGLTGSIGMGKTTTARLFAEADVPIWDADAAVHRLYDTDGAGVPAIRSIAPQAIADRRVDREHLRSAIANDQGLLTRIEAAIHPLVAEDRQCFVEENFSKPVLVFDIPLLFETGADDWLDGVVVVTASPDVQKDRVLARPGMTEEHFKRILSRQTPDAEKRERADFLVFSDKGIEPARSAVRDILHEIQIRTRGEGDA